MTPRQGQARSVKWYKMVNVNGAYMHGQYEKKLVEQSECNVHVKVSAMQDGWTGGQKDTTYYTDPHNTQVDLQTRGTPYYTVLYVTCADKTANLQLSLTVV